MDDEGKTLAEARIVARSSDPEWVGDELFRLQVLAQRGESVRSAISAEISILTAFLSLRRNQIGTPILFEALSRIVEAWRAAETK